MLLPWYEEYMGHETQERKLRGVMRYIRNCDKFPDKHSPNHLIIITGERTTTVVLDNEHEEEIEELKDCPPGLTRVQIPVAMDPIDYGDGDCVPGIISLMHNQENIIIDLRIHIEFELTETGKTLVRLHNQLEADRAARRGSKPAASAAESQELD